MDDCSALPSIFLPALAGMLIFCSCGIIAAAEWHVRLRKRRARLYEHFKQEFKRIRIEMRVKILQVEALVAATQEKAANAQVMKKSSGESTKTVNSNSNENAPAIPHREPLLDVASTPRDKSRKDRSETDKKSKKEKNTEKTNKDPSNSKGSGNKTSTREKEGQKGTEKTDKKSKKSKKSSRKSQKSNKTDAKEEQKEKSFEENNKDILR